MSPEVLVVDDHAGARQALCDLVRATPGLRLAGSVGSGEAAVTAAERSPVPLLVLMDVRMPGIGGATAARQVHAQDKGHVVLLMSTDDDAGAALADELALPFVSKSRLTAAQLLQSWLERGPSASCRRS